MFVDARMGEIGGKRVSDAGEPLLRASVRIACIALFEVSNLRPDDAVEPG
jgi:hypothetical protein